MDKKYKVYESPYEFLIDGGIDRGRIRVHLDETCWTLENVDDFVVQEFGFFEIGKLANAAVKVALKYILNPKTIDDKSNYYRQNPSNTTKVLSKILASQFSRLKEKINPTVLAVQRAIFSCSMGCGPLAINPKFYALASKYLINDIITYRPAAVAARYLHTYWGIQGFEVEDQDLEYAEVARAIAEYAMEEFCKENWKDYYECLPISYKKPLPLERCLELLNDWKLLYSFNRKKNTALNRTLMNCPGVSSRALLKLCRGELKRPVFKKLEFFLNIAALQPTRRIDNSNLFFYSTEDEIKKAINEVSASTHNKLSLRKFSSVEFMMHYSNSFPGRNSNCRLLGLVRKSIRWHREEVIKQKNEIIDHFNDRQIMLPPIPLPISNGKIKITFLDSINAILVEAEKLQHCISNYVEKAVNGDCFLFHIDHLTSGEIASIEVDRWGRVIQACGPKNQINLAAKNGESLLKKWGKNLLSLAYQSNGNDFIIPDSENCYDLPF